MKILTNWLRTYVPNIPADDHQLADDLTLRGIAVEGVHDLGPQNGHLFEMDITTNRVDAMNHYGIAREAATIYNLPLAPLDAIVAADSTHGSSRPSGSSHQPDTASSSVSSSTPPESSSRPERSAVEKSASLPPTPLPLPFPVRIAPDAKDLCGRFTAQVLRNVTIAPSTGDIKAYFELLGQKQISNAVDASNFVLLGMGHPTHAFDLDKIVGGLVVRLAHNGEKLKLLDGTDRTLEADDLVVADEKKALALAGVMGGWDSMITPETRNILIEAAWFDQASIRRSSRRHGLHTDASHRFERGADFNAAPIANRLVAQLILQHGGQIEGDLIDVIDPEVASRTASRPPIDLSVYQVQRHLGTTIDPEGITSPIVHQYLTALGCTLTAIDPASSRSPIKKTGLVNWNSGSSGNWNSSDLASQPSSPQPSHSASSSRPERSEVERPASLPNPPSNLHPAFADPSPISSSTQSFHVQLPSWRLDLEREIDLIEEVARVYGYNRFANTLPTPGIVIAHPTAAKEAAVRTRLLALGFSESVSSTFASQQDADLFYADRKLDKAGKQTVPMENPLSEEASLLRPSLVPGMVTMLSHNLNRDVKEVRLFEQGQTFTGTILADSSSIDAVHETAQLSLGLTTASAQPTPLHPAPDAPFFELKGVIESLISLFDLANRKDLSFRPEAAHLAAAVEKPAVPSSVATQLSFTAEAPAWLQPGRSATALVNNQPIAHFGELVHAQKEFRKLRQPIYLAQLDLAALYELPLKKVTARDLSRFQAVERDFSFTFPDTMQWHTIAAAIHALAIPELQRLTPTEIFRDPRGKSVPPAHYALLLKCVFQSNDRTLREDELTTWWSTIIATLTSLGGTIRAPAES